MDYPIVIAKLSKKDGGGYVGYVPDLPGCMSDGESPAEALANTRDAIQEWIASAKKLGRQIPKPGSASKKLRRERETLIKAAKDAALIFNSLERRIEQLSADIRDMQEEQANNASWIRFSEITKISPSKKSKKSVPAFC